MTLIYRTTGLWGAGQGSRLSSAQVDGNFYEIDARVADLEANPPQAVSIAEINVVGNQMTITLTDSSDAGPFTLPTAVWKDKGEWVSSFFYFSSDLVKNEGNVYLVLYSHTSGETFDPDANDGLGHSYYSLILSSASQPYDIDTFYSGELPSDGTEVFQHISVRQYWIPADFENSAAYLRIATTTETLVFSIYKNDDVIGDITFEPGVDVQDDGGQYGTFSAASPTDLQFYRTNRLKILAPTLSPGDDTAIGLSVTIAGFTGLAG